MKTRPFVLALALCFSLLAIAGCQSTPDPVDPTPVSTQHKSQDPQAALTTLVEGNQRMAGAQLQGASIDIDLLTARAEGQKPYAAIIGCADSRSGPEIIFDAGYSELFVCRLAGNVAPTQVRASTEYAVKALGTRLIVVMGHTRCGAVDATIKNLSVTTDVTALVSEINPGVKIAQSENWPKEQLLDRAIIVNAYLQKARLLKYSDYLRQHHDSGKIRIVVAVQDLATGKVAWIDTDGLIAPQTQGKLYSAPTREAMQGLTHP